MQHNKPIQWVIPIVVAMLVSVGLAGCIDNANRDCVDIHCITRVETQDARLLEEKYGVHTLRFNDDGTGKLASRLADGAVYWQVSRRTTDDTPISDIVGYDMRTQQILGVSVGVNGHSTRHEAWGDLVVFVLQHPERQHPPQLVVWNRTTDSYMLQLDIGEFRALPSAFDGDWVLLSGAMGEIRGHGIFAYNVHDGRALDLYRQLPMNQYENGTGEVLRGTAIAGGRAYYALSFSYPENVPSPYEYNLYTNIYEHDLESDEKRLITHRPRVGNVFMDAGSKYLAWDEGTNLYQDIYVMDRETEEIHGPFQGPGKDNSYPRTEGDWVIYTSTGGDFLRPVIGIHIASGITRDLLPMDSGLNVAGYDTDGEFFHISALPYHGSMDLGPSLQFQFYGRLPVVDSP